MTYYAVVLCLCVPLLILLGGGERRSLASRRRWEHRSRRGPAALVADARIRLGQHAEMLEFVLARAHLAPSRVPAVIAGYARQAVAFEGVVAREARIGGDADRFTDLSPGLRRSIAMRIVAALPGFVWRYVVVGNIAEHVTARLLQRVFPNAEAAAHALFGALPTPLPQSVLEQVSSAMSSSHQRLTPRG
jgi:hypothetical protein